MTTVAARKGRLVRRPGFALVWVAAVASLLATVQPAANAPAGDDERSLHTAVAELRTRVAALETRVADLHGAEVPSPIPLVAPGTAAASAGLTITLVADDLQAGPHALSVLVHREGGEPVTGATVTVMVRMPAMDHGVSGYPAVEVGPGHYEANEVSLGMVGEWLVEVTVVRPGRTPATAHFRLTLAAR